MTVRQDICVNADIPISRRAPVENSGGHLPGGAWWQAVVSGLTKFRHRQDVVRTLDRLDDRTLRDIGIERCDIAKVADDLANNTP